MYIFKVLTALYLCDLNGALECYSCTNIQHLNECNSTIQCKPDEVCSHATAPGGNGKIYSLGCGTNNECGVKNNGPGTIVGRDLEKRQLSECHECCSSNLCNKDLCVHLIPSDCVDDANFDCARLNTVFQICSDINHAKSTCPRFCNLCNVVDGNWSSWSSWTQCDVTCENGTETRVRACNNPKPANGGIDCVGQNNETKSCQKQKCPIHGKWTGWSEWELCSATCGIGMTKRIRSCTNPKPSRFGDHCFGEASEYKLCSPQPCAVDGSWSHWEPWTQCDVTCANGTTTRVRTCTNPQPAYGGQKCAGQNTDTKSCQKQLCPVNGSWSGWSEWELCSATCGKGMTRRIRTCTNPKPSRFGYQCVGEAVGYKLCTQQACTVNGSWSEWSSWDLCSVTCGMGIKKRIRSCSNPVTLQLDYHCLGEGYEYSLCMPKVCDGGWSDWEPWSNCMSPCGIGNHSRARTCNNPKPPLYGKNCTGQYLQVEPCNSFCTNSSDCYDIKMNHPDHKSGIYVIQLWKSKKQVSVFCDMDTDNGGWTVFQNRLDGSVDFYRNFKNYTQGFGNLTGEFWLGLETLHEMSSQGVSELRIEMSTSNERSVYEVYKNFSISSAPGYAIHIAPGTGTAGDDIMCGLSASNGATFSTFDRMNDTCSNGRSCPIANHGAWWYMHCTHINLNGKYCTPGTSTCSWTGMTYYPLASWYSLKTSKMMFRRFHA